MKTTFDLPDKLLRRLKLRAVHDGRNLKDVVADALRAGLEAKPEPVAERAAVVFKDKKTGLPVIQCRRAAPRGRELTPERIDAVLGGQDAE